MNKQKQLEIAKQEAEIHRFTAYSNLIDKLPSLINTLLICLAITTCVYFLAGTTTKVFAEIVLKLENLDLLEKVLGVFTVISTVWALYEKRQRQKEIKKQSNNNNRLQLKLDTKKKSSNLQSNGKTRKGD